MITYLKDREVYEDRYDRITVEIGRREGASLGWVFSESLEKMENKGLANFWDNFSNSIPMPVSLYSTLGGTIGYTSRLTTPVRSISRSVSVNTFCVMPGKHLAISEWRIVSLLSVNAIFSVHLRANDPTVCSRKRRLVRVGIGNLPFAADSSNAG